MSRKQDLIIMWKMAYVSEVKDRKERMDRIEKRILAELKSGKQTVNYLRDWASAYRK